MVLKKTLRLLLGIVLVLLGLIGWIMPIVPGWPLLIPGLVILGEFFPPVRRLVEWAKRKVGWKGGPQPRGNQSP